MENEIKFIIGALRSSHNRRFIPGGKTVGCCRCNQAIVISPIDFEQVTNNKAKPACPPCYGRLIRESTLQ